MIGHCELCARGPMELTRHHLIPRTRHSNRRNRRDFDRQEIRERVAWLCRPCHSNLHVHLSTKELETDYNRIELLAAHPDVARFTSWIRRKPIGTTVPMPPRRR